MKNGPVIVMSLVLLTFLAACGGDEPPAQPKPAWAPPLPDDAATRSILQMMPESAQFALAIPSLDAVGARLPLSAGWIALATGKEVDPDRLVQQAAADLDVEGAADWTELLAAIGVDSSKPAGLFARLVDGDVEYAGVLPLSDTELFSKKLALFAELQSGLPQVISMDNTAYFGSTPAFREELLARRASPAGIAYGTGEFPGKGQDEAVLLTRLADIGRLLSSLTDVDMPKVQPVIDHLAGQCDEVVLTLGFEGDGLMLRLAAHEMELPQEGEGATPQPPSGPLAALNLHPFLAKEAIAAADIRLSPGLLDLVGPIAQGITGNAEDAKKAGGMAKGLLTLVFGDEIAAAFTGLDGGSPSAVAFLELKSRDQIRAFLTMGTVIKDPLYDYNGVQVFKAGAVVPFDLYLGLAEKHLLLATSENEIKKTVDLLVQAPAGSIVSQDVLDHAGHGFVLIRGKNVVAALAGLELPVSLLDLGFANSDLMLTLDRGERWRQAALLLSNFQELGKASEASPRAPEASPQAVQEDADKAAPAAAEDAQNSGNAQPAPSAAETS